LPDRMPTPAADSKPNEKKETPRGAKEQPKEQPTPPDRHKPTVSEEDLQAAREKLAEELLQVMLDRDLGRELTAAEAGPCGYYAAVAKKYPHLKMSRAPGRQLVGLAGQLSRYDPKTVEDLFRKALEKKGVYDRDVVDALCKHVRDLLFPE